MATSQKAPCFCSCCFIISHPKVLWLKIIILFCLILLWVKNSSRAQLYSCSVDGRYSSGWSVRSKMASFNECHHGGDGQKLGCQSTESQNTELSLWLCCGSLTFDMVNQGSQTV